MRVGKGSELVKGRTRRTSFSRNWVAKLCKNRRAVKNGWNVINLMFDRLFLQL